MVNLALFLISVLLGFELFRRSKSSSFVSVEYALGILSAGGVMVVLPMAGEAVADSLSIAEHSAFGLAPSALLAILSVVVGLTGISGGALLYFRDLEQVEKGRTGTRKN